MPLRRDEVEPLGRALQRRRTQLRLSQDDMVELFRKQGRTVDKSTISRVENAKTSMPDWFFGEYMGILQRVVVEDAEVVGLKVQPYEEKQGSRRTA